MAAPGIYASARPAASPGTQRPRAVQLGGSAKLSRQEAALSGSVNASGVMAIAVALAALWAVDRYAFNVPFFKATGAKGAA